MYFNKILIKILIIIFSNFNDRKKEEKTLLLKMTDKSDYYDHLFKIVLVGDAGVGKTHLLSRYIKGYLPANKLPTVGV